MALAGPDHELALAAVADLAGDRVVEKAVLQSIDDKPFRGGRVPRGPVRSCAAMRMRSMLQPLCSSAFMSLMVAANASGRTVAPRRRTPSRHRAGSADPGNEDLAPALGAQVEQLVAGAAQKTGEIEVARLERVSRRYAPPDLSCPVDTLRSPQKRITRMPFIDCCVVLLEQQ